MGIDDEIKNCENKYRSYSEQIKRLQVWKFENGGKLTDCADAQIQLNYKYTDYKFDCADGGTMTTEKTTSADGGTMTITKEKKTTGKKKKRMDEYEKAKAKAKKEQKKKD